MKIIFVNKPIQNEQTLEPQIIDGEIYYWTVIEEMLKANETIQEWLKRKEEYMKNNPKFDNVEGILFYDAQPLIGINFIPNVGVIMIRYDYIKKLK